MNIWLGQTVYNKNHLLKPFNQIKNRQHKAIKSTRIAKNKAVPRGSVGPEASVSQWCSGCSKAVCRQPASIPWCIIQTAQENRERVSCYGYGTLSTHYVHILLYSLFTPLTALMHLFSIRGHHLHTCIPQQSPIESVFVIVIEFDVISSSGSLLSPSLTQILFNRF